jgi:hypothetical protein
VTIADPVTGNRTTLTGKLDSSAAISVLPAARVAELGPSPQSDVWVAGYDVQFTRLPAYFLMPELAGCAIEIL